MRAAALVLLAVLLDACAPLYVAQSAAGHAGLLARRRGIARALGDPDTPPELRAGLLTAEEARTFAFDKMGLARSRDFSTYVVVDGAVTWLVTASKKTSLDPYRFRFPPVGSYPYKGYFKKERALAERDRLERAGMDACVFGASAYNTPLPISDPLPSSALERSTGALAALMIHELAHGSLKQDEAFEEAAAEFIGRRGAQEYLVERFGLGSLELREYAKELEDDAARDAEFARLRAELSALYAEPVPDEEKLRRREPIFEAYKARLGLKTLNNAVVAAHGVYHEDLPFGDLFVKLGGDWKKFVAALNGLDDDRPGEALRKLTLGPPRN